MNNYKYKFSVIIPIYNVEKYLEDAIESVVNQTIGFDKNIQLILVNDGSKDNSEKICLKYKDIYPNNIVYVKQENAGVSVARNNGMNYIEGEYVNFLDGDDKWELNSFEIVLQNFEKYKNRVDVVACRKKFFDRVDDYHLLDYKFEKTKIVDILEDYDYIHLHITSSFIKSKIAKKYKFDTKLKYGEDAKYINEIIIDKCEYLVIKDAIHYYRKRMDFSSAIQNREKNIEWYTTTLEYFYKELINISKEKFGEIIPYIQYLIMYDFQWRIKEPFPQCFKNEIKNEYIENIVNILQNIEDYIICEQKNIYAKHKIYVLSLKYKRDIKSELQYIKGILYFKNIPIFKIRNNNKIFKIDILDIEKDCLRLEGRINCVIPKEMFDIYINVNSKEKIKLELKEGKESIFTKNTFGLERKISYHYTFKANISLQKVKKIRILFTYMKGVTNRLSVDFGNFAKLSNEVQTSYYSNKKYLIKYERKNILIKKNTKSNKIDHEKKYIKELFEKRKIKIIIYRLLYYICKVLSKKKIWLISDRQDKANDNGEVFFKYIQSIQYENIKVYFVLDKRSEDFNRIKKIGKVIKYNSIKHKIKFLQADKIISSQANDYVINIFKEDIEYIKDLCEFDFVFLQHGIIKSDLSKWLNKYSKNIKTFITSGEDEYNSIINGNYYYDKNQVKLTGLPRYDNLKDNRKKSIIILPTQRRMLVEWNTTEKNNFSYNPYFKDSEMFKFYNDLINDKRIINILKQKGYKMKLGLHPLQQKQSVDFKENSYVKVIKNNIDYSKEFSENSLLITDYSSVAFDFAYLRKPVIYTQFDKDSFYDGQVYDIGYFEDKRDGFGPVCYDYESTVQNVIDYVKNDCKIEEKYLERINKFYAYNDRNNCKRVYEEIIKLN